MNFRKILIWFLVVAIAVGYNFVVRQPEREGQLVKITPLKKTFKATESPHFTLEIEKSKSLRRFFRLVLVPWPVARAEEESDFIEEIQLSEGTDYEIDQNEILNQVQDDTTPTVIASPEQSFGFYGASEAKQSQDSAEDEGIAAPSADARNDTEAVTSTDFVIETPNPQVLGEATTSEEFLNLKSEFLNPDDNSQTDSSTPAILTATTTAVAASTTDASLFGQALEKVGGLIDQIQDAAQEFLNDEKTIEVTVSDPSGEEVFETSLVSDQENLEMEIPKPEEDFQPGKWELEVEVKTEKLTLTQDIEFPWGVLAINTNKSVYLSAEALAKEGLPNEQVFMQMAALDDQGQTLCGAELKLAVQNPQGQEMAFSTDNGSIKKSSNCGRNNITYQPDYFAYYQVGQTGTYQMKLTNLTNGYEIKDSFEVRDSAPFNAERIGPTRIYPPANYEMKMKVKINQDFQGEVKETVPASFEILNQELRVNNQESEEPLVHNSQFIIQEQADNEKVLIWQNINLKQGDEIEIKYTFDAPDVSPTLYLLGPLNLTENNPSEIIFKEARQWQLAADSSGINLEVPLEMVDLGLNSQTVATGFGRTDIYLDSDNYDGATYYFEIVAKNTGATDETVDLRDSTGTNFTEVTITVPANTTNFTRYRSVSWAPDDNAKRTYRVRTSATVAAGDMVVQAARIIVQQSNATKTRIQIPLNQRAWDTAGAASGNVDSTVSTTYEQGLVQKYSLWKKDESRYASIPTDATAWTLEAILDSTNAFGVAYAALFNATDDGQVIGAEISVSGTTMTLTDTSFSNTAPYFHDLDNFEVRIKTSNASYTAELRSAVRLYVTLTNLTKAEVLYRVAQQRAAATTAENIDGQRVLLDTSLFTNPTVFFEASGYCADNAQKVFLEDDSTRDSGTGGSDVTGSGINFNSSSKTIVRTSAISPTSGDRFYAKINASTNNLSLNHAWIVVQVGGIAVSGTIYSDEGSTAYNCSTNNLTVAAKVNGAGTYSTTCTASGGTYSIESIPISAAGDVVTVFLDGETEKAVTVTKSNVADISDLHLYQNSLIVRHEDAGPVTNANLGQYDKDNDTDIHFISNSNNLAVDNDTELHLWTGDSFSPGGSVTTSHGTAPGGDLHLDDSSTLTAGGTFAIGGSWTADASTTFTPSSNLVEFTATSTGKTITPATSSFYNLNFASLNWTTSYDTTEAYIGSLTFDSSNGVLYAGTGIGGIIYRCDTSTSGSCDDSGDWTTSYDTTESYIGSLTFDSSNGVLYAGTGSGGLIYRCDTSTSGSCDDSGDWTTSYDTTESSIRSLTLDSTNGVLYAGTGSGGLIYRCATSTLCDESTDWTTSYDTTEYCITSLTFNSNNNVIYAGSGCEGGSGIIYRCATSTLCDESTDWTTSYDTTESYIGSLTFDSSNGIIYAGTNYNGLIYRCATSTGCDAAEDWTTSYDTTESSIPSLTFDSSNGVLYAGSSSNGLIYRCATSTGCDAAGDWTMSYDTTEGRIYSFVFDSSNGVIYAGTGINGIIYRGVAGSGGWTFQDNATTTDNFTVTAGAVTGPSSGHLAVAGNWANNGGTFTPNSSEVKFNATATGKTLSSSSTGNLIFYDIDFNSSTGGWTVNNNATSTRNWKLTSGAFTAANNVHLEVDGQFTNTHTTDTVTWGSGSVLFLNSGTNYTINTKTAGDDTYTILEIGANTDIRMWDSSALSYNVASSGSLYSMDHTGNLYIYGDYHVPAGSTDYWSYANDFDGTASANRQVDVLIADGATINVDSGTTLQIIGTNTATTTATSTSVTGSYGFTLTNGTLNAQYYKFGRLNASGLNLTGASATITNLANGEFDNSAGSGASDTFITVTSDVINNNTAKTFAKCRFDNTNGNANYNVTETGTASSYWTFSTSYGDLDGEANDSDPGGDPGFIRWDDSSSGTLSETASSSATFSPVTYSFSSQNDTGNLMGAVYISDNRGGAPGWDLNITSADWSRTGGGSMDYDGNGSSTGQLCLVLTSASIYATSGSMTGVTKGSDDCFDSGTSQIQIADATVGNGVGTYWLVDQTMSQFVPAMQQAGAYTTTLEIVAS